LITSLTSGTILAGIFLAPIFKTRWPALSAFIYSLYAPLCHQQSGRSFFWPGSSWPPAVAVQASMLVSSAVLYSIRSMGKKLKSWLEQRPLLMVFSALPMVLDFSFNILGLANSPLFIKSLTGFVWSSLLPFTGLKLLKSSNPPIHKKLDLQK